MQIKDKKNKRIKISNIDDLNKELKLKGYNLEISDFDKFKEGFIKTFNILYLKTTIMSTISKL